MFFPLMLLKTAPGPFSSKDYIFERKFDGIRIEYSNIEGPQVFTRNQSLVNHQFPELLFPFEETMILDGEAVSLDDQGNEDFERIIKRFFMKNQTKIQKNAREAPVTYLVFDVLYYRNQDLRNVPLLERKAILQEILLPYSNITIIPFIEDEGLDFFEKIREESREGVIAKKKDSSYVGKRSSQWMKIINWVETEARITGYRKKDRGLLCTHMDGKPLGVILTGFDSVQRQAFFKIAEGIYLNEDREFVYLQPVLKCKLRGRGFVSSGGLRSASFVDFIL